MQQNLERNQTVACVQAACLRDAAFGLVMVLRIFPNVAVTSKDQVAAVTHVQQHPHPHMRC
jgi:ABC-type enterochelin transport system permease subunit